MHYENGKMIEQTIPENALVLDIGGWWQPFPRANYVIDAQPYETRNQGITPFSGQELFTKDTWIIADVNSHLPFPDKKFDFVICSHVLEDIRDPINLLKEMSRIGKSGYVEFPSRFYESIRGHEHRGYAGLYHHRWLVSIVEDVIHFKHKPHSIHGKKEFSIPKRYLKKLDSENSVNFIFWENIIAGVEIVDLSMNSINRDLQEFAKPFLNKFEIAFFAISNRENIKNVIKTHLKLKQLIEWLFQKRFNNSHMVSEKFISR